MLFDSERALEEFIRDPSFPCVGAKSALGKDQLTTYVARSIDSAWNDVEIQDQLMRFAWGYQEYPTLFTSFAVIFEGPDDLDEARFERHMWERIQSLTAKDSWRGQTSDPRVSADPDDPHFSLSFGGQGFFVVGLHPGASRPARRFAYPTMIFNLHDQFEALRAQNRYEKLRGSILERDLELAGSINPMLARHGTVSEARQYSGRKVPDGWSCPYHREEIPAAADPLGETEHS
ncbi:MULTISPECIES: guanitoxin biosynthesis heme-dependent pre-guanitoxin N-hydroxylase GntA [unclassified Devosia]|uniref:guanitoxin biosynthesis heme-dependent pre-guanitoxin N-hydroxylase GntA n=1 Tax=unclassified Devosia TaxID=196773 RepID=UPI0015533A34|nr:MULTISPECIES: guanitoxin biosynthesis heme-dependent pre-guanitoxin N-hydroxylase GntA [unclassified Devosia]